MLSDIPTTVGVGEPIIQMTLEEGSKVDGSQSTTTVIGTTTSGSVVVGTCTVDGIVVTCPLSTAMEGDTFSISATSDNGLTVQGQPQTVSVTL